MRVSPADADESGQQSAARRDQTSSSSEVEASSLLAEYKGYSYVGILYLIVDEWF